MKSGNFNFMDPSGPLQAYNGTALPYIYRVSQEEGSIFWEVIVSVILSKTLYINMCPIPNGFPDTAI
jgi:hypothetical protein